MTGRSLVSVVTIFLDAQRFLEEAVGSVLAQTYDDWELLLVDDGSTDDSTTIARRYARTHPGRIRYLEHDGHRTLGMSASRNLGLLHARGHYVAPLDADDVWLPHRLERQVSILDAHPRAAMVYGRRQYWESWARGNAADRISEHGIPSDVLYEPPALLSLTYAAGQATNPGSDVMVRRDVAVRLGGHEETFRGMYEDQAFLVKVYLAEAVFVADECWMRYRQHGDSHVARAVASGESRAARQRFLAWVEAYLAAHGTQGTEVWTAVERELWPYRHPVRARMWRFGRAIVRRALRRPHPRLRADRRA